MNVGATLKQKAGPLPVWGWALIFTGLLAMFLMRRKQQNQEQTNAAADQTNSDLGSAAELANLFNVAGLMPYQGGDIYVNTTNTPTQTPPPSNVTTTPKPGTDIQTAYFYKTTKVTDWNTLAKQLGVFGGNGQALYQYNLIPNKHTAGTLADFKKTPKTIKKGELIAVPLTGVTINLPYVGTVKS